MNEPIELLDRHRFWDWLSVQPRDRVIESAHHNACFLCSFVGETQGKAIVCTWDEYTMWDAGGLAHRSMLPSWARKLIARDWCVRTSTENWLNYSRSTITCGQMRDRYRALFPDDDPELTVKSNAVAAPAPIEPSQMWVACR